MLGHKKNVDMDVNMWTTSYHKTWTWIVLPRNSPKKKKKKLLGMLTKEDIESCGHSLMWTWTHTHVDRLMWTMTHVDKIRKTWTWIHINKIRIRKNRRHRLMLPKPQQNTHHKLWTRSKPRHMLLIPLFVTVEYFKGNQVLEKPWCDQVSQLQCQHLSWIYAPEAGRDPLHIHIHNKKLLGQFSSR